VAVGIQPEEFLVALKTKWAGNSDLSTYCPGDLWLDQAPEEADVTGYGVLTLNPEEAVLTADRNWMQDVGFTVDVYSYQAMDATARAAIQTGMTTAFCASGVSLTLTSGNKSAGAAWPVNGTVKTTDVRRTGVWVLQTTASFKIRMYGSF